MDNLYSYTRRVWRTRRVNLMTLDSWLAPRNPELRTPSPKRQKKASFAFPEETAISLVSPPSSPETCESKTDFAATGVKEAARPASIHRPPPKLIPSALTSRLDLPPEATSGVAALSTWVPSIFTDANNTLETVECFPNSPLTAIGMSAPSSVFLIRCADRADDKTETAHSVAVPFDWPLVKTSRLNDTTLLCASRREIATLDVSRGNTSALPFIGDLDEISSLSALGDAPLVAIGTGSGTLSIWDTREKSWARSWTRVHATVGGSRVDKVNPPVSHVVWTSNSVLATASKHNESVKFWDLRGRSQAPVNTTQSRTSRQQLHGINGLTVAGDYVWAVNTNGNMLKLSSLQTCPEYRIKLAMSSTRPRQALALVTNNRYPLLACAGAGGTTLFTPPSALADEMGVDAVQARRLRSVDTIAVQWHPYTQRLVTLSDYAWQFWDPLNPGNFNQARTSPVRNVKARQQSIYF